MNQRILILASIYPESQSSAAGTRICQLIKAFIEMDLRVHFACTAQPNSISDPIHDWGVTTHSIRLNDSSFDTFVSELNPDIVLFDRFMTEEQFSWRVAEHAPSALRILDTEDLHFLRDLRRSNKSYLPQMDFDFTKSELAKREVASILRSDLSLMISESEINLLKEQFHIPETILYYLPIIVDPKIDLPFPIKTFEERKNFVFIGNFWHEPNWDCVQHIVKDIWPKIHESLPDAELHIYGAYASEKVQQLASNKRKVQVLGRAASSLATLNDYRILLAPLRFGAGIKGKFIEAMTLGLPYITSLLGNEGMVDDSSSSCKGPEEVVSASVAIYGNKKEWERAQSAGTATLARKFSQVDALNTFTQSVLVLKENLAAHRRKHFMQALLFREQLNASKYFSRWIEEKNK